MKLLEINGKVINLERIHFIRLESESKLVISFGTDFVRFEDTPTKIQDILTKIVNANNE
jgi:hypothetical protein